MRITLGNFKGAKAQKAFIAEGFLVNIYCDSFQIAHGSIFARCSL